MPQRTTTTIIAAMAVAAVVVSAPRLAGQSIGVSPPVVGAPGGGKALTLSGSMTGGYNGNATENAEPAIGLNPLFRRSSSHVGGDLQLQFSAPGRRVGFGVGLASAFRFYEAADTVLANHHATAGISAGLTPHMTVWSSVLGGYSPPFQVGLFSGLGQTSIGQATVIPIENPLSTAHIIVYGASSGLSYNATKRSYLMLGHEFREVRLTNGVFAGRAQDAIGAFHVALAKSLGLRLGYRYQQYEYVDRTTGFTKPVRADNIDLGLDYGAGHGLKLARRTTATFGFGLGTYTDERLDRLQLRVIGNASLTQGLFRTWSVTVGYYRGLNFYDGFGVPIFSDSVNARLSGQLSRRVSAYANASYSMDRFGTESVSKKYRSHRSIAGIRINFTEQLDGFVQYVNYHHAFPDGAFLLQGALPTLNRQGVNGGLRFTLPLIGDRRFAPRDPS